MLSLTRKTDYAIIALTHLAGNGGVVCTAREIAEKYRIPTALLMNVLKTLCQGELVRSVRGAHGGYTLGQAPEDITLAQIVSVIEGPIRLAQCSGGAAANDACELMEWCPVQVPVQRIHARLENFLRQITLADIAREAGEPGVQTTLAVHRDSCRPTGCCQSAGGGAGCA